MRDWFFNKPDVAKIERRQMACRLGYDPYNESSWPNDLIERLISIERENGREALTRELHKLVRKP